MPILLIPKPSQAAGGPPPAFSGSLTITGGGGAVLTTRKGGLSTLTISGGGQVTTSYSRSLKAESLALSITGGGSVTIVALKNPRLIVVRSVYGTTDYESIFGTTPRREYRPR